MLSLCPVFLLSVMSCTRPPLGESRHVSDLYRRPCGMKNGLAIWIVDGPRVRSEVLPEFLYGGNHQRYPFIPAKEIWIDNSITAEEYRYTVEHEVRERGLMAKNGLTYFAAHDSALAIEHWMREIDKELVLEHETKLQPVSPRDSYGDKELPQLLDSVSILGIYRTYVERRGDIEVWIVDGAAIRRDIYPDFGLSGNDLAYHFIPPDEIWIDSQVSCEELEYSVLTEMRERNAMQNRVEYDIAYQKAIDSTLSERAKFSEECRLKFPLTLIDPLTREKGTGDEK